MNPWYYLAMTTLGCIAYGWYFDKTLEYTMAGPYWTAMTLLSIKWLGIQAP